MGTACLETVTLELIRPFKLTEESLGAFWLWLTSLLFRPQQIEPTAERFQWDFGTSLLYGESMAALKKAWARVNGEPESMLAFETWQKYLTVTYGHLTETATAKKDTETGQEISELESLFLRQTYLARIARLLIWAALSQGKTSGSLRQVAKDALTTLLHQAKPICAVHYDPRDLSRVYVKDRQGEFIEVPYRTRSHVPVTLAEQRWATRKLRSENRIADERAMFEAIAKKHEIEAEAQKKTMRARRSAQKTAYALPARYAEPVPPVVEEGSENTDSIKPYPVEVWD